MPSNKKAKKKGTGRSNNKKKKKNQTTSPSTTASDNGDGGTNTGRTGLAHKRYTEEDIRAIMKKFQLNDYRMSKFYVIGFNMKLAGKYEEEKKAYKHGAEKEGCVWCLLNYADCQFNENRIRQAVPYFLEGAIRGNTNCISGLLKLYNLSEESEPAHGLKNFWLKILIELDPTIELNQANRKDTRDNILSKCGCCGTEILPVEHLCAGCRCYSYCSKECQRHDWFKKNHRGECRQIKILKRHYRTHAKELCDAMSSGIDPKTNRRLQRVRTKLGLNRPEEDYEQSLQRRDDNNEDTKDDNDKTSLNGNEYVTGRPKDGTVFIGSTPNLI